LISVGSEVQVFPGPPFAIGRCGSGMKDLTRKVAEPGKPGDRADGAVAQLGEHLLCKQGVSGSIPLSSTKSIGVETDWFCAAHVF
jgi:hypothetical protein